VVLLNIFCLPPSLPSLPPSLPPSFFHSPFSHTTPPLSFPPSPPTHSYLGETLIYCAYALLCQSKAGWGILASFVLITFVPNMIKKDKSLAKYEEFEEYKKKTWVMVPFIY